MTSFLLPPIHATVVFAEARPGSILSIPPLERPSTFTLRSEKIMEGSGREVILPDEETRARVLRFFRADPESVFVVEVGPDGFIRDYPIAPEAAK